VAADPVAGLAEELPERAALLIVGLLVVAVVGTVSSAAAALTPRRSYATVAIIGIFLIPNGVATLLVELETGLLGQVAVLLSPADVLDGVNAFFFDVSPDNRTVLLAGLPGWSYPLAAGAWIVGSLAVLARRYQHIEA
jgi:hypothetical protein